MSRGIAGVAAQARAPARPPCARPRYRESARRGRARRGSCRGLERRQLERRVRTGRRSPAAARASRVTSASSTTRTATRRIRLPETRSDRCDWCAGYPILPVWVIRGAAASVRIGAWQLTFSRRSRINSPTPSAAAAPSVVQVQGRRRPASGLVYADNVVLTTVRALGRGDGLHVRRDDGQTLDAELAGWDPTTSLAVLRVPDLGTAARSRRRRRRRASATSRSPSRGRGATPSPRAPASCR